MRGAGIVTMAEGMEAEMGANDGYQGNRNNANPNGRSSDFHPAITLHRMVHSIAEIQRSTIASALPGSLSRIPVISITIP